MMRRLKGTCWDLEQVVGMARDGDTTPGSHDMATLVVRAATAASWPLQSCTLTNRHPLSSYHQRVSQVDARSTTIEK